MAAITPQPSVKDTFEFLLETALIGLETTMKQVVNDRLLKAIDHTNRLIANLKVACSDKLKTICEQDDKVKAVCKKLDKLVKDILDKKEILDIETRIDDITKDIPVVDWMPWITDVQTVSGIEPNKATVTIIGRFSYAESVAPQFKLNGTTYQAKTATTQKLVFDVEIGNPLEKQTLINGSLSVAWKHGYIPYVSWTESVFNTFMKVVPMKVGTIKVDCVEVIKVTAEHRREVRQSSTPFNLTCKPDQNYKLIPGTQTFEYEKAFGASVPKQQKLFSVNESQVTYTVNSKNWHGTALILFDQEREFNPRNFVKSRLQWDGTLVEKLEARERVKRVVFEAFNGNVYELQPGTPNPFIDLTVADGVLRIKAKKASEVDFGWPKDGKPAEKKEEKKGP